MDTPPLAESPPSKRAKTTGSLSRRMILIAAAWIGLLLVGGGFALDRVLVSAVTRNFDDQLQYVLRSLLASSEIGPDGEVLFSRDAATDPRFVEPYSGLYWQVSAPGAQVGGDAFFRSRSLWDRRLQFGGRHEDRNIHIYDSRQFPDEKLRIVERDAQLPGSKVHWRFQVAQGRGAEHVAFEQDHGPRSLPRRRGPRGEGLHGPSLWPQFGTEALPFAAGPGSSRA